LVGAIGFEPPTPCAQGIADAARKLLICKILKFNELQNAYWKQLNFMAFEGFGSYKIIYMRTAADKITKAKMILLENGQRIARAISKPVKDRNSCTETTSHKSVGLYDVDPLSCWLKSARTFESVAKFSCISRRLFSYTHS
jgi:hypothetical protein